MTNAQAFNVAWAIGLSTLLIPMLYLAIRIERRLTR